MSTVKKKIDLFNSDLGDALRQKLLLMEQDNSFRTEPSYTANVESYPNGKMPFIETHLIYLSKHSDVDPNYYFSNLRLMLKIRN